MKKATTMELGPYQAFLRCACGRVEPEITVAGPLVLTPRLRTVCPGCGRPSNQLKIVAMREVREVTQGWLRVKRRVLRLEPAEL